MSTMTAATGPHELRPRREFDLPDEDEEFLDARGLFWETILVNDPGGGQSLWLLIHGYPLPSGYVVETSRGAEPLGTVLVGIRLTGYPGGALDMAYFHPALRRADGRAIYSISDLIIDQKSFQQWSRHYTPTNPFRVGVDNIGTHLGVTDEWLRRELVR